MAVCESGSWRRISIRLAALVFSGVVVLQDQFVFWFSRDGTMPYIGERCCKRQNEREWELSWMIVFNFINIDLICADHGLSDSLLYF